MTGCLFSLHHPPSSSSSPVHPASPPTVILSLTPLSVSSAASLSFSLPLPPPVHHFTSYLKNPNNRSADVSSGEVWLRRGGQQVCLVVMAMRWRAGLWERRGRGAVRCRWVLRKHAAPLRIHFNLQIPLIMFVNARTEEDENESGVVPRLFCLKFSDKLERNNGRPPVSSRCWGNTYRQQCSARGLMKMSVCKVADAVCWWFCLLKTTSKAHHFTSWAQCSYLTGEADAVVILSKQRKWKIDAGDEGREA